ncbi:hypothetical protein [Klebsiella michiganensis]|uniref:hypothetical protein n=1 Tax=Klebsiella michiganensis TaxID=1134687 RepID=UPI001C693059|nr:hypothetical protein [Klebsiella michiganensis]
MKTPKQMLEEIAGEMMDAEILLEVLYSNTDNSAETDAGISCIVRSLLNTNEKAQGYIERLSGISTPPNRKRMNAILQMMFFTRPSRQENSKILRMFIMRFTSPMKITVTPQCIWQQRFSTMQEKFAVN